MTVSALHKNTLANLLA